MRFSLFALATAALCLSSSVVSSLPITDTTDPVANAGDGPIINNAVIKNLFWNPSAIPSGTTQSNIDSWYSSVVPSAFYSSLKEYNTGTQTIGNPTYAGSFVGSQPSGDADRSAIESFVEAYMNNQDSASHTASSLYVVNLPAAGAFSLDIDGTKLCSSSILCYTHGTITDDINSLNVHYVVVQDTSAAGTLCNKNCIQQPRTGLDSNLILASAVIADALTSADSLALNPVAGWQDSENNEVGDKCAGYYSVVNSYPVQKLWSNKAKSCVAGGGTGGFSDPQFNGFAGQSFQVHGRPDTIFNLISYPSHGLAVNSEFKYIDDGKCFYTNTPCWTHPGTYFGKITMLINNSTRLMINSGSHQQGSDVYINDKHVLPSDSAIQIDNQTFIHVSSHDVVTVQTSQLTITTINSDNFLNLETAVVDKYLLNLIRNPSKVELSSMEKPDLHGLLGQTWENKEYITSSGVKHPYQGTTDDYVVDNFYSFMQQ